MRRGPNKEWNVSLCHSYRESGPIIMNSLITNNIHIDRTLYISLLSLLVGLFCILEQYDISSFV